MTKTFANPYIIFYPVISRTGASFPVNKTIREVQGSSFNEDKAWRGDIVVAKYRSGGQDPFLSMIDISMADFPLLKNYLLNHEPLGQVGRGPTRRVEFLLTYFNNYSDAQRHKNSQCSASPCTAARPSGFIIHTDEA